MTKLTGWWYWMLAFTRRKSALHEVVACLGLLYADGGHKTTLLLTRITRKRAQELLAAGHRLCKRCCRDDSRDEGR